MKEAIPGDHTDVAGVALVPAPGVRQVIKSANKIW